MMRITRVSMTDEYRLFMAVITILNNRYAIMTGGTGA
jgi:hypothetical protein